MYYEYTCYTQLLYVPMYALKHKTSLSILYGAESVFKAISMSYDNDNDNNDNDVLFVRAYIGTYKS